LTRRVPYALAFVAAVVFVPALWGRFVADDFSLLHTLDGVTSPLSPFVHNDLGQGTGSGHFYRPLWVLLNAGVFQVFGARPGAFHALNLVLSGVVVFEVWELARRLLDDRRALAAALAFAVYPRHGESVAWISGNTDLLATALILAALLALLARRRLWLVALLSVAAALSKETGLLIPVLGFVLLRDQPERRRDLLALSVLMVGVLVARTAILGGAGGYTDEAVTPRRVAASAVSYLVATFTPPQLEVLHTPALVLIPLALALLAGYAAWRVDPARRRIVLVGLALFAVALVPVLGEPLDLNNATGERLLFLPSVGLALAFAAVLPERSRLALGAAGVIAAGLCVLSALNWVTAGQIAKETASRAARLAPSGGELVVLSLPESYRTAHVFTNSFDLAARRAGAPGDSLITWCAPIQVRHRRHDQVRFRGPRASTTWSAPFDFPVVGDPSPLTPGCGYARVPGAEGTPGLELSAMVTPRPSRRRVVGAYFDGSGLTRVR